MTSNQSQEEQAFSPEVEMYCDDNELYQPLSPSSQCIHTSILSLSIKSKSDINYIDPSKISGTLKNDLLRVNPRFSSVVVADYKVEDHVIIPDFPSGLSQETYTQHFNTYLSKISQDVLPEKQPLWDIHIFNYPTRENVQRTLIFRMYHALGDGLSIMGAVFSCLKRTDNPSLPLTFPAAESSKSSSVKNTALKKMGSLVSGFWNSGAGFAWSVLQSTLLEDDQTVIRSCTPGLEFMPADITTISFSLDQILLNDVVVGLVFYGSHLYSQTVVDEKSLVSSTTGLVLLNTRMVNGYRSLEDMVEKDLWGNHFSFIHLAIPSDANAGGTNAQENKVDPLSFIFKAKKTNKEKQKFLECLSQQRPTQIDGKNTSMAITNLGGPTDKMVIAEHPIQNIYFTVSGCPQGNVEKTLPIPKHDLLFTVLSYMGKLTLVMRTEKGFINSKLLASCMKEACKKIFEDACVKDTLCGMRTTY
ncbi:hypothetical protein MKX01_005880 [Papaver californicum]|nr:hypothetical protein MKX01_005880 [Papaver californicum]